MQIFWQNVQLPCEFFFWKLLIEYNRVRKFVFVMEFETKTLQKKFFSRKKFANSSRHNSILQNNVKEFSYQGLKIQSQSLKILKITCHISFCMCPQCFFNLESFRCVIHWRVALLSRWSLSQIKKRYSYEISRWFDCLFPNNSK